MVWRRRPRISLAPGDDLDVTQSRTQALQRARLVVRPVSVAVRPMRADDAAAVAALSGELGYPATAGALLDRFVLIAERANAQVFVAQAPDGRIVGWVHVYGSYLLESDPHAEIGGLVVAEKARGQRIGAALMSAAEGWAADHGYGSVRVRSRIARADAHGFYEHLGYSRIKTQHSFRKAIK